MSINPINLEGYAIRNKHTQLYLKKGSTSDTYSKNPQVFTKLHFLKSSMTNKIKYNMFDLAWIKDIEVIDLQSNIIGIDFVSQAIEYLEDSYRWRSMSSQYASAFQLERIQTQINILKGDNTNEWFLRNWVHRRLSRI